LSTSHSPNDVEYLIVLFTLVPLKFEGRSLSWDFVKLTV